MVGLSKFVIDVSHHQGTVDWEAVKAAGVEGAIIRCGYGMDQADQDDRKWKRNADECTRLGIPFGAYLYSYADSTAKAQSEAQHAIRLLTGYKLSYPVYYDLEEAGTESGAEERARIFCEAVKAAGYMPGVYANKNWWDNYLSGLTEYTRWVARYNSDLGMEADMWQYTSGGSVAGITGRVDLNHCYRDFPAEIGTESTEQSTPQLAQVNYRAKVNTPSGVNVRSGAGESYGKITAIANGTEITITKELNGWGYAQEYGGWVSLQYMQKLRSASYMVGQDYTLLDNMNVRTGPGTNYARKSHSQLTAGGQAADPDKNGSLQKGTRVTCQEIRQVGADIWMRIPSGWIAAVSKGKVYIA